MCTLLVALGVWPDRPLVVAANRDESLLRPASAPELWAAGEVAARSVLAPRDLEAGGTWLGLNDAGLFVGITNRFTGLVTGPDAGSAGAARRSRGELVFLALGAESPAEARARIVEIDPAAYNPFHLVIADRDGGQIVWGDGARLHEQVLEAGIHFVTERSFDAAPSGRHLQLEAHAEALVEGPAPSPEAWRSILADHRPHAQAHAPLGDEVVGLESVCVHATPRGYGTRSSTLVELGPGPGEGRFFHAAGRPCQTPWRAYDLPTPL